MPSMSEVIAEHTELSDAEQEWLRLLVSEWQLLADLSFSDLVLWVPDRDQNVFWAAAQIRPTTGPTALLDDVVGDLIAYSPEHLVSAAFVRASPRPARDGCRPGSRSTATPSRSGSDERVIGVVEQHTSLLGIKVPSSLEQAYLGPPRSSPG